MENSILEKYWGDRQYKVIQTTLEKQNFTKDEKLKMLREAIDYLIEKNYDLYHDFMDNISVTHPDWFNMLSFDKKNVKNH